MSQNKERTYILLAGLLLIGLLSSTFPSNKSYDASAAYCEDYLLQLKDADNDFKILKHFKGEFSEHYTFQHLYRGIAVEQSFVYFHFYPNNEPIVEDELWQVDLPPDPITGQLENFAIRKTNGEAHIYKKTIEQDSITGSVTVTYLNQDTTFTLDGLYHKTQKDTTVQVGVFYPNPSVTSGLAYGQSGLLDNNDSSNELLKEQQKEQLLDLLIDTATGRLLYRTDLIEFKDLSRPTDVSFDADKLLEPIDRAMFDFETANVYFHIHNFVDQLDAFGYRDLAKPMYVDPHALNGADNSAFTPYGLKPNLQFGTGGVDDAEDAQVIIHEYAHGLATAASPNTWGPTERRSIEEGICDYICMSYSNSLNNTSDTRVFSWDGHNSFFNGFDVHSKKQYTRDLIGNTDNDREIWSSVLYSIELELGREITNILVLEHLFYLKEYSTMPSMAAALLQIDKILFASEHSHQMIRIFEEHSISPTQRFELIYTELEKELKGDLIQHRSNRDSPFTVILNKSGEYALDVYRLNGQHLLSTTFSGYQYRITEPVFSSDFLMLVVLRDKNDKKQKPLTFKMYNYYLRL